MLLLSRDVSLMFRFDSAMDLGNGNHTFDDGWFDVVRFSTYSTSDSTLGHISVSIKIYRSSWSHMIIPTYEIHAQMMTYLLSYHDPPLEPLWSHPVRPLFFYIWLSSCFSFWGMPFDLWVRFNDGWFSLIWFSDLSHIQCHTGAYFCSSWDL